MPAMNETVLERCFDSGCFLHGSDQLRANCRRQCRWQERQDRCRSWKWEACWSRRGRGRSDHRRNFQSHYCIDREVASNQIFGGPDRPKIMGPLVGETLFLSIPSSNSIHFSLRTWNSEQVLFELTRHPSTSQPILLCFFRNYRETKTLLCVRP